MIRTLGLGLALALFTSGALAQTKFIPGIPSKTTYVTGGHGDQLRHRYSRAQHTRNPGIRQYHHRVGIRG
jgi:hypothetical protein